MTRKWNQSRIYDNMVRAGNTSNRDEQLLAADIIRAHTNHKVETEVLLHVKQTASNNLTGERTPRADIVVTITDKKIVTLVIRVMGEIHKRKPRMRKDAVQKEFLEDKINGYTVIDFWYDKMPFLFLRHDRKLDKLELRLAYNEIRQALDFIDMKRFDIKSVSAHQKLT